MKKLILAATLAALTVTSAAMAAPLRDPQPGDLKANANYGFDQKEGGRSAKSRLTGGDVTYVLNNHWDIQYVNNSAATPWPWQPDWKRCASSQKTRITSKKPVPKRKS